MDELREPPEWVARMNERIDAHVAKKDGHDGTFGCKRCEALSRAGADPRLKRS